MKFEISSGLLLKHLDNIDGVIPANPILPILENFLLELENGVLTVTASDLQSTMVAHIEVDTSDTGSVAVPAKILVDTLKNLPEQPITFSIDEDTYGVELGTSNGSFKLAGSNPVDFPEIQAVSNSTNVEMTGEQFLNAINYTAFATSTDDMRPAMTGVFVKLDDAGATFVATDGHRLVKYSRGDVDTDADASMILPRKSLMILKNSVSKESTIRLSFNASHSSFSFDNIRMVCRLVDERFPDYNNAIPTDNPNEMVIDRLQFLNSLKRVRIYANKTTRQVRLKLEDGNITVSAEDLDFQNEASESLPCDYSGEAMEIGFNANFLMELLSNLESNMVKLELSAPNKAGLLIPKTQGDQESILMLVMPVMLNTYANS